MRGGWRSRAPSMSIMRLPKRSRNALRRANCRRRQAALRAPGASEPTPGPARPLAGAITHNQLGRAWATLGRRESGSARLEAAVVADREALDEFERQQARLDWARTQTHLGNALHSLCRV